MHTKTSHVALITALGVSLLLTACNDSPEATNETGERIPRSAPGDKGKYYLIEQRGEEGNIFAITKRVGPDSIVFTRTETNCSAMEMRILGESWKSINEINDTPSKWFEMVSGSSKSDLANYLCEQ